MRRIISFMHVSLDGYVAGPNGEMNWIRVDEEIFDHVGKRIETGDTALYGRVTWQMMEGYWPTAADNPNATRHDITHSAWYKQVQKVVLSRTMNDEGSGRAEFISDDLAESLDRIKQQDGPDILLFGSPTATHALMRQDLIDGYWLFVNPIILGRGIPLFEDTKDHTRLSLVKTRPFSNGVIELDYVVNRE